MLSIVIYTSFYANFDVFRTEARAAQQMDKEYTTRSANCTSESTSSRLRMVAPSPEYFRACHVFINVEIHSLTPEEHRVFATRVEMTSPYWKGGYYRWIRFAANTTPRLPGYTKNSEERVTIPWPQPSPKPKVERTYISLVCFSYGS